MENERRDATSPNLANLARKFKNKKYRASYVKARTRRFLAHQMRAFRGDLSQTAFAKVLGKKNQSEISRYEDPAYGGWTLTTLTKFAERLDLAVIVQFVDFSTFMRFTDDVSEEAASPPAYSDNAMREFEIVERDIGRRRSAHRS